MFQSDFDPPQRSQSVRGLLGIVAAVLIGIGVSVYGYLAEMGPSDLRKPPSTVEPGSPAASVRPRPELPRETVEPAQYRSRPRASASARTRTRSGGVTTRPAAHAAPTASSPAASSPAPALAPVPDQADADLPQRGLKVPPTDA